MGLVLGDDVMATAMLDRLLHRCHVVNNQGSSYRMREYRSRYKAREQLQEDKEEKLFQGVG